MYQFVFQGAHQAQDASLRSRIGYVPSLAKAPGRGARKRDAGAVTIGPRASRGQLLHKATRREHGREQVVHEHSIKVLYRCLIQAQVGLGPTSGVGDQHIDAAHVMGQLIVHFLHGHGITEVCAHDMDGSIGASAPKLIDPVQPLGHHLAALGHEGLDHRGANVARGSGHQYNLVLQTEIHHPSQKPSPTAYPKTLDAPNHWYAR